MSDHFKYKDLPGPAWQRAGKSESAPDGRAERESETRVRFQEQLAELPFLSDETRTIAHTLYDWESIQALGRHIYEAREDVYPVSLSDMSQALELPVATIRAGLTDLERCRAIKLADGADEDTLGVTLEPIYFYPATWTPLHKQD